jgi:hypothetical protein
MAAKKQIVSSGMATGNDGLLSLSLVNVFNEPVRETVAVVLKNQQVFDNRVFHVQPKDGFARLDGLFRAPRGRYMVEVDAPSYHAVSQFINIAPSGDTGLEVKLPVDPSRVTAMQRPDFPTLEQDLKNFLGTAALPGARLEGKTGQLLYEVLPDILCAGLLNLAVKARNTLLNGRTALSFLGKMVDLFGDRLFAEVSPDLVSECRRATLTGVLHTADDSLHHPLPGFVRAGSFKTLDHYGNLQLTLSVHPENTSRWMVDMDIDDAQGLEHVFQVVQNTVTGDPTHPYNIHEILVEFQQLDPGYTLSTGETHQAMAAGA